MQQKEFKLIVAGGRSFNNPELMDKHIRQAIKDLPNDLVVTIVSGMAPGADRLAYRWAEYHGCKCIEMPADWEAFNKRAGFIRNVAMANESQGLLAFWDGQSKGTQHMITTAQNHQLEFIRVIPYGTSTGKITTYKGGILHSLQDS